MEICPACISKYNSTREKQIILNDTKCRKRRLALSCSKKIIYIIIWNNFKMVLEQLLPRKIATQP